MMMFRLGLFFFFLAFDHVGAQVQSQHADVCFILYRGVRLEKEGH